VILQHVTFLGIEYHETVDNLIFNVISDSATLEDFLIHF